MAVIYLKHPEHGTKVAISDLEADADKLNGWEEFDPTAPIFTTLEPEPVIITESVNQLQPRRRGRRPAETLQ